MRRAAVGFASSVLGCIIATLVVAGSGVFAPNYAAAVGVTGQAAVAQLRSALAAAQADWVQLQSVAATWDSTPQYQTVDNLMIQVQGWGNDTYLGTVQHDLAGDMASLINTGRIPPEEAASTTADLASAANAVTAITSRYSLVALVALAETAGFRGDQAATAAAVAMAESHGDPLAVNVDSNHTVDYGLWQINWPTHKGVAGVVSHDQLFIPIVSAEAAWVISDHGTNWTPWSTYDAGAEIPYLPAALAYVQNGIS